jgi:thiamine pyrophosphokinase
MRAVIVASGDVAPADARHLDAVDLVIAADGGAVTLERLGRRPDRLVGDFDSVDPAVVERFAAAGTAIERHPADNEASDTELALTGALDAGATEVVVLGALGGARLDHELANVLLLAGPAVADHDVRLAHGSTTVRMVGDRGRLGIEGAAGDLVTLLPIGGDAVGVTTDGLRWELHGATLTLGPSRGLSNEVVRAPASVSVAVGRLLVVETALERSPS